MVRDGPEMCKICQQEVEVMELFPLLVGVSVAMKMIFHEFLKNSERWVNCVNREPIENPCYSIYWCNHFLSSTRFTSQEAKVGTRVLFWTTSHSESVRDRRNLSAEHQW